MTQSVGNRNDAGVQGGKDKPKAQAEAGDQNTTGATDAPDAPPQDADDQTTALPEEFAAPDTVVEKVVTEHFEPSDDDVADPDEFAKGHDTKVDAPDDAPEFSDTDTVVDPEIDLDFEAAEARIEELTAEVAELKKEKDSHWEKVVRLSADMDNLRKRTRKEIEDSKIDVQTRVLKKILPVIDNLDRAAVHAAETADPDDPTLKGIQMVLRQFEMAVDKFDVKEVEAMGKPFDPQVHEAIAQEETADVEPGAVTNVLQKGYTIGSRLLRPSLVSVAKAPPEGSSDSNDTLDEANDAEPTDAVPAEVDEEETVREPSSFEDAKE